jgi:hypothetical protein
MLFYPDTPRLTPPGFRETMGGSFLAILVAALKHGYSPFKREFGPD